MDTKRLLCRAREAGVNADAIVDAMIGDAMDENLIQLISAAHRPATATAPSADAHQPATATAPSADGHQPAAATAPAGASNWLDLMSKFKKASQHEKDQVAQQKKSSEATKAKQKQKAAISQHGSALKAVVADLDTELSDDGFVFEYPNQKYRPRNKILEHLLPLIYEAADGNKARGQGILAAVLTHNSMKPFSPEETSGPLDAAATNGLATAIATGIGMLTPQMRMSNEGRRTLTTLLEFCVSADATRGELLNLSRMLLSAGQVRTVSFIIM